MGNNGSDTGLDGITRAKNVLVGGYLDDESYSANEVERHRVASTQANNEMAKIAADCNAMQAHPADAWVSGGIGT